MSIDFFCFKKRKKGTQGNSVKIEWQYSVNKVVTKCLYLKLRNFSAISFPFMLNICEKFLGCKM